MIYLYAIADRPEAPKHSIRGLKNASLSSLPHKDICAVISQHNVVPPLTEYNLWRHEAVLESLMADRAVLPARFGVVVADETSVQEALEKRYVDFIADLARLRGRVELGLRVLWEDDFTQQEQISNKPLEEYKSGRDYILARIEEQRETINRRERAEKIADRVHAQLARLSADSAHRVLSTPRLLLTGAYLVERGTISIFRDKVASLSADHPALRFLCTGPWPPFNFVKGEPIHICYQTRNDDRA